MKPWFYAFAKAIMRLIFALIYPVRMLGAENLPSEGAAILYGNHVSLWDPLAAGVAARRPLVFMAKKELFDLPVVGWCVRALGAFPVNRGNADMTAMRTALSVLKEGRVLGIFPQGGRDLTGDRAMESGIGLIALRSGAPVIPMHITGRYRPFRRNTLIIGKPVNLEGLSSHLNTEGLRAAMERIERAVAELTV